MLSLLFALNLAFGNSAADGSNFAYAPDSLMVGRVWKYKTALTATEYAAANWWPVTDVKPADTDSVFYKPSGWVKHEYDNTREEIDWIDSGKVDADGMPIFVPVTNIVHYATYSLERQYAAQIRPVAIPTYSVADLTFWAAIHNKLNALVDWLKAAGYYEVYLTTQSFAADNEVFGTVKSAIVAAGIVTEQELTEALEYARIN